jgi:hypothetical protein
MRSETSCFFCNQLRSANSLSGRNIDCTLGDEQGSVIWSVFVPEMVKCLFRRRLVQFIQSSSPLYRRLNQYPLHFIHRDLIVPPIIQCRRPRRLMRRHLGHDWQRSCWSLPSARTNSARRGSRLFREPTKKEGLQWRRGREPTGWFHPMSEIARAA